MSQLFKSILARGFLAQRAVACCQAPCQPFKLPISKVLTVPLSHSYVTNSNPLKFNKYESKLAFDTDFSQYPDQRYNNKQRVSKPSYQRKFDRDDEARPEQYGIEDAEPVEFVNKPADYSSHASDAVNGFDKYNLPEELISAMNKFGYTTPFEIQESTLTETLAGR